MRFPPVFPNHRISKYKKISKILFANPFSRMKFYQMDKKWKFDNLFFFYKTMLWTNAWRNPSTFPLSLYSSKFKVIVRILCLESHKKKKSTTAQSVRKFTIKWSKIRLNARVFKQWYRVISPFSSASYDISIVAFAHACMGLSVIKDWGGSSRV